MTEIKRSRRAPKAVVVCAATALLLNSCTGGSGETPPPAPTETTQHGNDAVIKQFREVAEKAVAILVHPPEGVNAATHQKLRNETFDSAFGPKGDWELEIFTQTEQQLDNPGADDVREVSLFTGPPLPSLNNTSSLGSITLSLNKTKDAIGATVGRKAAPLEDGTTPLIVVQANTSNDPPANKSVVASEQGVTICQEAYVNNPFDDIYGTMKTVLDALQRNETPSLLFPTGGFIGTHNPDGFCPQ